jgi:hypothetical protein
MKSSYFIDLHAKYLNGLKSGLVFIIVASISLERSIGYLVNGIESISQVIISSISLVMIILGIMMVLIFSKKIKKLSEVIALRLTK